MKFRILVEIELPYELYNVGRTEEGHVRAACWVFDSYQDFQTRFRGSRGSVQLLPLETEMIQ